MTRVITIGSKYQENPWPMKITFSGTEETIPFKEYSFEDRRRARENDIAIRYQHGIPTFVKRSNEKKKKKLAVANWLLLSKC